MDLAKQYNKFAQRFSEVHDIGENSNRDNRKVFYDKLDFVEPSMKLLDLACGDGLDLLHYKELGAEVFGLDASEELVELAKKRLPEADIRVAFFEKTPFESAFFDVVLSKYAIQTSADLTPIFKEISRIIKPGGILMYLVTHPLRQYLEKKELSKDYFEQKVVDCHILNDTIVVQEPTHTMNEYLTNEFLNDFDTQSYEECWDAAAEQVDGRKYPGYFILKARRR